MGQKFIILNTIVDHGNYTIQILKYKKKKAEKQKKRKQKRKRIIEIKRIAEEWEIWDKEEEAVKSEAEAKKLIPEKFHR